VGKIETRRQKLEIGNWKLENAEAKRRWRRPDRVGINSVAAAKSRAGLGGGVCETPGTRLYIEVLGGSHNPG
jgi:hypothetical protein